MAEGSSTGWRFRGNEELKTICTYSESGYVSALMEKLNKEDDRNVVPMGNGDPSLLPGLRNAVDKIVDAVRSAKLDDFTTMLSAKRAINDYLRDLPLQLSDDDIFVTSGCTQAIDVIITALVKPGENILLPKPSLPYYEELRDEHTKAMVIVNPGNHSGSVFSWDHLRQIAYKARKLGIAVISHEVYADLTYQSERFTPMGSFGNIVPVLTVGSTSKRWIVPGGWIVVNDPNSILKDFGVIQRIEGLLNISPEPLTFIQGVVPHILEKTKEESSAEIIRILSEDAEICFKRIQEIPCMTCPAKPEGGMFVMVELDVTKLDDEINNDEDFCEKLALEESVIVLPGTVLGMENWLRLTFALESSLLQEGLSRIKAFCKRHAGKPSGRKLSRVDPGEKRSPRNRGKNRVKNIFAGGVRLFKKSGDDKDGPNPASGANAEQVLSE